MIGVVRRLSTVPIYTSQARRSTGHAQVEGLPISEVSRWLGHWSTTTVDLYGHLVPEASSRARDALDKAFGA